MKNFLQLALHIAPFVFFLMAALGFINQLFDMNLGLRSGVEASRDPVINVILILIGAAILLLPKMLGAILRKRA